MGQKVKVPQENRKWNSGILELLGNCVWIEQMMPYSFAVAVCAGEVYSRQVILQCETLTDVTDVNMFVDTTNCVPYS